MQLLALAAMRRSMPTDIAAHGAGVAGRTGAKSKSRSPIGILVVIRLGLIGDLGQTENSASTLDHLTASNPGSVINVGDLSYADGYQPR